MNSFFTTYATLALVAYSVISANSTSTFTTSNSIPKSSRVVTTSPFHSSSVAMSNHSIYTVGSSTATPASSASVKNTSTITPSRSNYHSISTYSLITSSKGSTVILSTTHSSSVFSTLSHLSTIRSSTATPAFSTSAKNASAIISSRSHNYSISSTIFEYTSTNYPVSSFIVFTTTPTDPKKLHYQFPENESNPCIRFDGEVDLQISYKNQTQEKISLTQGATVSGVCPDKNRSFYITLSSPAVIFTINFLQDSESWHLHSFDVKLVKVDLAKNLKNDQADLKVPLNHSYVCDTDESFPATTSPNYNVTVTFRHLKLQPFKSNGTFDSPFECPAKDNPKKTSSVVPIAVGGALAGLIVIVLVAYLIGRRRGNRGYQKV